jgi:hypothetical protein
MVRESVDDVQVELFALQERISDGRRIYGKTGLKGGDYRTRSNPIGGDGPLWKVG